MAASTARIALPAHAAAAAAVVALVFAAGAAPAEAGRWHATGALIHVSVEVDGRPAPLYPAPDGSGRYYVEAHASRAYALRVSNRSAERVAVLLAVDGLNVVSGERERGPSTSGRPGRMYVLDPWGDVRVQGWRTSLDEVRRFTFVDERRSYAARTGRANSRMGWIEAWAYRERPRARAWQKGPGPWDRTGSAEEEADAAAAPPASRSRPEGRSPDGAEPPRDRAESFPGTGWGRRTPDPATLVDFVPEATPSDSVTLRYEYAPALRALGVLPAPWPPRDRLWERERGDGFARDPDW